MNIKIHVKVNEREREKKNYSPLVAIAFSTNGASYKKKTKQHKTIFIKKKYMYNVMLHFFFGKK